MPKRGTRIAPTLKSDFYHNDHDVRREKNTRRVSFKPSQLNNRHGGGGGSGAQMSERVAKLALRTRYNDDDDMSYELYNTDGPSTSQFNRGSRRKGSPIPKGKFFNKLQPNQMGWYQVTVMGGHRFSKDDILRALLNAISPDRFLAHYWRIEKHCVIFFVDDFHVAERLSQLDRNVQMSDGYRLAIRVRASCPLVPVDEPFKEKMLLVMASRYNAQTRALDLSKFHADPQFKDIFCGLFRTPVMSAAIDIMEKNIPEIEALNLNENNITTLESFKNVMQRLPNLKILYLGDNKIPSLAHLLVFRNVPLVELVLKNNPLRTRYKDAKLYQSEVRRKFPKLRKLDDVALEAPILFDINDINLPVAKASFLCDPSYADMVRQFLQQYITIFDSDNRQPLLDAYHEQAQMSISVPPASQAGRLHSFWKFNRNLRRQFTLPHEESIKYRALKVGRLAVVSTLAEWPKTQHDLQSLSVDLTFVTPKMIAFTVGGLFKELDSVAPSSSTTGDVRYFYRQMIVVPAGSGFCIRNELILVTNALQSQARLFMKQPIVNTTTVTAAQVPAATSSSQYAAAAGSLQSRLQVNQAVTTVPITLPQAAGPDDNTKLQMVNAMSAQSQMNIEWSRKCLEETNWDYAHAIFVFDQLQKESKIPAEAFIK